MPIKLAVQGNINFMSQKHAIISPISFYDTDIRPLKRYFSTKLILSAVMLVKIEDLRSSIIKFFPDT